MRWIAAIVFAAIGAGIGFTLGPLTAGAAMLIGYGDIEAAWLGIIVAYSGTFLGFIAGLVGGAVLVGER